MKFDIEQEVTLGNSKSKPSAFKIASSAKAFKILSSSLYKNKILAIVRELSCNALDAHKLNGNTAPFTITLPDDLSLEFRIRDYGPGLSQEDMQELYTTYFASTKNDSNDFIGALGLGSKSPFSYTNIFTVISRHNNISSLYTLFLENGEPNIRLVRQEENGDTESGIEIIVPVIREDISKWNKETYRALFTFAPDQYRVILEEDQIEIPYLKIPECGFIRDYNFSFNTNSNVFVVYGNILYPVDESILELSQKQKDFLYKRNIAISMPLGTLDIAPSREELSYDEKTIQELKNRLDEISNDSIQKLEDKVSKLTKRELARLVYQYSYDSEVQNIKKYIDFESQDWEDYLYDQLRPDMYKYIDEPYINDISLYSMASCRKIKYGSNDRRTTISYTSFPSYNDKRVLFINKTCKRGNAAITRALSTQYYKNNTSHVVVFGSIGTPNGDKALTRLKEIMDTDEVLVLNSSDIKIESVKRDTKREEKIFNAKAMIDGKLVDLSLKREDIANSDLPYLHIHNNAIQYGNMDKIIKYDERAYKINKIVNKDFLILTNAQVRHSNTYNIIDDLIEITLDEIKRIQSVEYIINNYKSNKYEDAKAIISYITNEDNVEILPLFTDRELIDAEKDYKYLMNSSWVGDFNGTVYAGLSDAMYYIEKQTVSFENEIKDIMTNNPLVCGAIITYKYLSKGDLTQKLNEQIKQFGVTR